MKTNCLIFSLKHYLKSGLKGSVVCVKSNSRAGVSFYHKINGVYYTCKSHPKGNGNPYWYKHKPLILKSISK